MATTTASRKAKGRKLQKEVARKILEKYPELAEADVESTGMGQNGLDVKLSEKARQFFPYAIEAKARKNIAVYSYYEQAKKNTETYTDPKTKKEVSMTPLVVIKADRREPLVLVSLDKFMEIVG